MTNDPSDFVYSERKESFSIWKNNNNVKATFRLLTHEKRKGHNNNKHQDGGKCEGSVFLPITIEPGATKSLPSEYDQAIRSVSEATGQVVGGLCPWLTKVGEEDVVVHTSLDYQSAFQEEEARNLIVHMKKESELREALALLEKRKVEMKQAAELKASLPVDLSAEPVKKPAGRPKKVSEE